MKNIYYYLFVFFALNGANAYATIQDNIDIKTGSDQSKKYTISIPSLSAFRGGLCLTTDEQPSATVTVTKFFKKTSRLEVRFQGLKAGTSTFICGANFTNNVNLNNFLRVQVNVK